MKLDISIRDIEGEGYLCIRLADLTLLKRSKAFKPPSIEEVALYCESRKNGIDAEAFVAYYATRGWMVTKGVKMRSWKDAVTTWEKNNKKQHPESLGTNLNTGQNRKFEPEPVSKTAMNKEEYEQYKQAKER